MQLFKFTPGTSASLLENGQPIEKWESVMWTERYSEPGEFEIVAPLSSGLRTFLPEGALISHTDTYEVMIVENQEVTTTENDNHKIKLTGRTMPSWLENRFIGVNLARTDALIDDYNMTADYTWNQIARMINDHIYSPTDMNDQLVNVVAQTSATGAGTNVARTLERKDLLATTLDLLAVDNLGIKTQRTNVFPGGVGSDLATIFMIYKGVDRSDKVRFSWRSGDLDEIDYLFSLKTIKNSAFVVGKYFWRLVDVSGHTNYDRRMILVDANDIDGHYDNKPSGSVEATILNKMLTLGNQAIMKNYRTAIARADLSLNTKYQYRTDYNVGDIVWLDADYNTSLKVRVNEVVEIEDETGYSAHPTLDLPRGP